MNKQKIIDALTPQVKRSLKSPYSAILCPPEDLRVVTKGRDSAGIKNFTVYGYVDSQNSYGAMLRTDFEYDVTELSDGTYSVGEGGVGDNTPTARKAQLQRAQAELKVVQAQTDQMESMHHVLFVIIIIAIIAFFVYFMSSI